MYILQINVVIIEGYVAFYVYRLLCADSVEINTEYLKILKNIHCSAATFNTKNYLSFLIVDILQISMKKMKKIFIKVILYINFEDLQIYLGSKNSPYNFLRNSAVYHNN